MCRCPAHNDRTPSLSVRVGERSILFHCFAGCATIDVMRALRDNRRTIPSVKGQGTWHDEPRDRQLTGRIRTLWKEARPISAQCPAAAYLAARGFTQLHPSLRYHSLVPLGRKHHVRFRPALLAALEDDTGVVALERLFLDVPPGMPANDLDPPKRMLGRPLGAAVRFGAASDVLGLAEGWETAWSAHILLGIPVWATLGAERLPLVTVPDRVRRLVLLPDNDDPGRRGAQLASDAHARPERRIVTRFAPGGCNDWNDRMRRKGRE
jgi:hypothetical protein